MRGGGGRSADSQTSQRFFRPEKLFRSAVDFFLGGGAKMCFGGLKNRTMALLKLKVVLLQRQDEDID